MPQDWSFLFPPLAVGIEPAHPMHLSQVLAVSLSYTPNVANACFVLIFSYNFYLKALFSSGKVIFPTWLACVNKKFD